ncbi:hypothetical protein ACEPAI_1637 [Sanghuangporus weigelae]
MTSSSIAWLVKHSCGLDVHMEPARKSARLDEASGGDCPDRDSSDDSLGSGSSSKVVANHLVDIDVNRCQYISPLPALPIELVVLIFKCAARDSKSTAASLSLVSRFARDTVSPLLFRSLVLDSRETVHLLTKFLTARQSIASYVRELWMRQGIDRDFSVVLSCPRIERLAITPTCFSALFKLDGILSLNLLSDICRPTPRELLLFPGYVRWDNLIFGASGDYLLSFLQGLTHLWLAQQSQLYSLLKCGEAVAGLSQLTHLASPAENTCIEIVLNVLNSFPKLQMFVMLPQRNGDPWMTREGWAGTDYDYPFRNFRTACLDELDKRLRFVELDQGSAEESVFSYWKEPERSIWTSATSISLLIHADPESRLDCAFLGFRILDGYLSLQRTSRTLVLPLFCLLFLPYDSLQTLAPFIVIVTFLGFVLGTGSVYSVVRLFGRWPSVSSLPFSHYASWLVDHEDP